MDRRKGHVPAELPKGSRFINIFLMLYMASVPLFTRYVSLNVISEIIFVIAFGSIALIMFLNNKSYKIDTGILIYIGFVVFSFLSLLWSLSFEWSFSMLLSLIQLLILYILLYSYISSYDCIDALILGLFISGIVLAVVVVGYHGITEYITLMLQGGRLGGVINNVNTIGLYMAVTVIIGFYYGYTLKKNWVYAITVLPVIVGFGTGSRKCLVMMVIGVCMIIYMQYRERMNVKSFGKLLAVICIAIGVLWWMTTLPLFAGVFDRLLDMIGSGGGEIDQSALMRYEMIDIGWEYFIEHPFSGLGVGASGVLTIEKLNWKTYLHNNFIELLASLGIVGFVLYYAIYVYLIIGLYKQAIKTGDPAATLMMATIFSLLVMDYGAVSYYDKMTYIYFAMASGVLIIGKRKERNRRDNG